MLSYIHSFADFLRVHLSSISVGLVATVLTIYGAHINGYFRKITKSLPFIARFALFIVLCSAGYAFLSSQAVKYLRIFLIQQKDIPLVLNHQWCFFSPCFSCEKRKKSLMDSLMRNINEKNDFYFPAIDGLRLLASHQHCSFTFISFF